MSLCEPCWAVAPPGYHYQDLRHRFFFVGIPPMWLRLSRFLSNMNMNLILEVARLNSSLMAGRISVVRAYFLRISFLRLLLWQ